MASRFEMYYIGWDSHPPISGINKQTFIERDSKMKKAQPQRNDRSQ